MSVRIPRRKFSSAELVGATVRWLVEFLLPGQTIRVAETTLEVPDSQGNIMHFHAGIRRLEVKEEARFFGTALPDAATSMEVMFPIDVADMIRSGRTLAGARCEISQIVEGAAYEMRVPRFTGITGTPTFGDAEIVSLTVLANAWEDTKKYPAETETVTGETWSTATTLAEEEFGLCYPIVIGSPGYIREDRSRCAGTQGVWVDHGKTGSTNYDNLRLVIANHHVSARRVYAGSAANNGAMNRFEVQHGRDAKGHLVAYIDAKVSDGTYRFSPDTVVGDGNDTYGLGFSTIGNQPSNQEYVGWYVSWMDDSDPSAGGAHLGDRTLRTATDVIPYLLAKTGMPVDMHAWRGLGNRFDACLLDFVIDARTQFWKVVQQRLLPLVPLALVLGPQGIYPVPWKGGDSWAHPDHKLDVQTDPRIMRASRVTENARDIKNRAVFNYCWSIRTNTYQKTVWKDAQPYDQNEPRRSPCRTFRISQERYRNQDGSPRIETDEINCNCVYDRNVARWVQGWRRKAFALARREVEYDFPADYGHYSLGDSILLTDSDVKLSKRVAVITELTRRAAGKLRVKLVMWEVPERDHGIRMQPAE